MKSIRAFQKKSEAGSVMRVLIVDDHPPMRQLIRSVVSDLAESVTECADGAEAVAAYAVQQFSRDDRVLMDLEMRALMDWKRRDGCARSFLRPKSSLSRSTVIHICAPPRGRRVRAATC